MRRRRAHRWRRPLQGSHLRPQWVDCKDCAGQHAPFRRRTRFRSRAAMGSCLDAETPRAFEQGRFSRDAVSCA